MPTQQVPRDASHQRVAAAVKTHRKRLGLTLGALSDRLAEVGRPIGLGQLSKLETGDRRVDVDDLTALAVALEVSPLALLLPPEADEAPAHLTAFVAARSLDLWRWGTGEAPLPPEVVGTAGDLDLDTFTDFGPICAPHRARSGMTMDDMTEHRDVLVPLAQAAHEARAAGLSQADLHSYLNITESLGIMRPGSGRSRDRGAE